MNNIEMSITVEDLNKLFEINPLAEAQMKYIIAQRRINDLENSMIGSKNGTIKEYEESDKSTIK